MKIRTKRKGIFILISSAIAGFLFPVHAKWILACLVIMGLISWYKDKKRW